MSPDIENLAVSVGRALLARKIFLCTAESCTGGGVSQAVTSISGSSEWFDRGFVTYSNQAKEEMLGVKKETLMRHGAVSEETAREMAAGALMASAAAVSLAVTGIAGPGGGSAEKPVGTVSFAWACGENAKSITCHFSGNREEVRSQSVLFALQGLLEFLHTFNPDNPLGGSSSLRER